MRQEYDKAAQDKEHRDGNQPDGVAALGKSRQAIDPEPSQGKLWEKITRTAKSKPEEHKSIIIWIECLGEVWPTLSGRRTGGTHSINASRNRVVAGL